MQLVIEFIYQAQSPIHTNATISSMVDTLGKFHGTKQAIIQAKACRGMTGVKKDFNIPSCFRVSLGIFKTMAPLCSTLLTSPNVSISPTARSLSNRQIDTSTHSLTKLSDYSIVKKIYDASTSIIFSLDMPLEMAIATENEAIAGIDPTLSFLSHIAPKNENSFSGLHPFHNHFSNPCGFISADGAVAFHVTVQPDFSGWTIAMMECMYNLLNLMNYISNYIFFVLGDGAMPLWDLLQGRVSMWNKFHIQQHSSFQSCFIMKSQVVQAYPCSSEHPWGVHDTVIVYCSPGTFSTYFSS